MNENETESLINSWILNELTTLQKNYFFYFKKKEINLATAQLIKFARERLSREYLELIKVFSWSKNTKNTLLFVYQQLLLLFHPSIPYVTEYIYQEITQQKILEAEIEVFSGETRNNKLWQVDCLLLLIGSIRQVRKKSQVSEFYLELTPEWKKLVEPSFDFNLFLQPLVKSKISILEKKSDFDSLVDLPPFGTLWYQQEVSGEELQKKLSFYEKKCERSKELLENDNFITRANPNIVKEERNKFNYYKEQKRKILKELEKI